VPTVVFAAGGSIETALLPHRLLFFRADHEVALAAAVSAGALDFVTPIALAGVTGAVVYGPDQRFEPGTARPAHLALAEADALVLHPATARILAECATGAVTCPVTRLFAFTPKDRIVVAPAIHPRMDLRIYAPHAERLRSLGCTVLGGERLFSTWHEIEQHLVARLGLQRAARSGHDVLLDELRRSPAAR
jgi:phosphopantothenoylcysteine synthetase/decarboxylase